MKAACRPSNWVFFCRAERRMPGLITRQMMPCFLYRALSAMWLSFTSGKASLKSFTRCMSEYCCQAVRVASDIRKSTWVGNKTETRRSRKASAVGLPYVCNARHRRTRDRGTDNRSEIACSENHTSSYFSGAYVWPYLSKTTFLASFSGSFSCGTLGLLNGLKYSNINVHTRFFN